MAIAFDASAKVALASNEPTTWTHTPAGTPRGVFVFFVRNAGSGQDIVNGVTYGGSALARAAQANDSLGEPGSVWGYWLGAAVPTGPQTVSVDVDATTATYAGYSITVTAGADLELAGTSGFAVVEADAENPSATVTGIGAVASYGAAALFSGHADVGSVTAGTGMTMRQQDDNGAMTFHCLSSTAENASGDLTIAFTATSEDAAMVAIALQEQAEAGDTHPHMRLPMLGVGVFRIPLL